MSTTANDGVVKPTTTPSGDAYGEKGIEQGDDAGAPSHPTPSPMSSNVIA